MDITELRSKLKENNTGFSLSGTSISCDETQIVLKGDIINRNKVVFDGVIFEKSLIIQAVKIKENITFRNCSFMGGIYMYGVEVNNQNQIIIDDNYSSCITVSKCEFNNQVLTISQNCIINGLVEINNSTNIGTVTILNSRFSSLEIKNCEINDEYTFKNNNIAAELVIGSSSFDCHIRHSENNYGSLILRDNIFKNYLSFKDNNIKTLLTIVNNEFEEKVIFDAFDSLEKEATLTLSDNKFKKKLEIKYYREVENSRQHGGCGKIYIGSNYFEQGLLVHGKNLYSDPTISSLILNLSNKSEGLIKVENLDIELLSIQGENFKSNVIFKNIYCNHLKFDTFSNYSNFQFINLQTLSEEISNLTINESNLEKFQFMNTNLSNFTSINIRNSNLSSIKSSNTRWFTYKQLKGRIAMIENLKKKQSHKATRDIHHEQISLSYQDLREIYRQLKFAMDQQGDKVESLNFRSYEMEVHFRYLQSFKPWYDKDRLILFLGKSNDHGINWLKPIFYLVLFTLLFYGIILYSVNPRYIFGFGELRLREFLLEFWKNKKAIPELLNPTHSLDKTSIGNFKISGYTLAFDIIYKLIFSFFIFQIVSAFRKFVK